MCGIFFRFLALGFLFCGVLSAKPWVMFNDADDTYLYDEASGQVYIRVKKGGKNYEDTFVRMGVQESIQGQKGQKPKETIKEPIKSTDNATNEALEELDEQKKLLKQAQELQRSIQGSILGGGE